MARALSLTLAKMSSAQSRFFAEVRRPGRDLRQVASLAHFRLACPAVHATLPGAEVAPFQAVVQHGHAPPEVTRIQESNVGGHHDPFAATSLTKEKRALGQSDR